MLLMSALLVVVWGPVKALFFVCAVLCFVSIFTFEIQALLCGDTQELEPGKERKNPLDLQAHRIELLLTGCFLE